MRKNVSKLCTHCGRPSPRGYWFKPDGAKTKRWFCDPCYEDQQRRGIQQASEEGNGGTLTREWVRSSAEKPKPRRSNSR